jgi:SAM-dependent MidA family methyltransferase
MELALYAPGLGYYERQPKRVGIDGDFYTSVRVGPLLGELLGSYFGRLSAELNLPFVLVEAGAHDGRLAADVLGHLQKWQPQHGPDLWLVEPSKDRRLWQQQTLKEFLPRVHWVHDLEQLAQSFPDGISGIFYSNELLDAFPVHRLSWSRDRKEWQVFGVAESSHGFEWRMFASDGLSIDSSLYPHIPNDLAEVLPDGFVTEICPMATTWWSSAARLLRVGRLLTMDYGLESEEFLAPQRARGTLRTYLRHQVGDRLLENPGEQDLTADVDFDKIQRAGETNGLTTFFSGSQRLWLTQQMELTLPHVGTAFPAWDSTRVRQFQTLTHPDHFGRRFRVLEQGK